MAVLQAQQVRFSNNQNQQLTTNNYLYPMNFLAHLYLSRDDDELMLGNFIADSVKGRAYADFSPGVAKGILLHRAIDSYTDLHPVFLQSVRRLRPHYRKYAGVIVDIFYDHFLAKNWADHSSEGLHDFTARVHGLLLASQDIMPPHSRQFLQYMVRHNIPVPYADVNGIARVLYGMSRRTTFESGMEKAVNELLQFYNEFEAEFNTFFPEINGFVKETREKPGRGRDE
jgi:acyl carrier protein phosphodiesterase